MKKSLVILFSAFMLSAVAQKNAEIDSRLLVNKEIAGKAEANFSNDKAAYDFMVFELDHGYFLMPQADLTDGQRAQLLPINTIVSLDNTPFDPALLSDPASFNFHTYNFQRSETKTVGYDLGNGTVLVFYSAEKLRAMYFQNSSNQ